MNIDLFKLNPDELTILAALISQKLIKGLDLDEQLLLGRFLIAVAQDIFIINSKLIYEKNKKSPKNRVYETNQYFNREYDIKEKIKTESGEEIDIDIEIKDIKGRIKELEAYIRAEKK